MKTDYPEFQNREIKVTDDFGLNKVGVVVDCNYHAGITIVDITMKEYILACLSYKEAKKGNTKDRYRKRFHAMVQAIHKGHINLDDVRRIGGGRADRLFGSSQSILHSMCAYS